MILGSKVDGSMFVGAQNAQAIGIKVHKPIDPGGNETIMWRCSCHQSQHCSGGYIWIAFTLHMVNLQLVGTLEVARSRSREYIATAMSAILLKTAPTGMLPALRQWQTCLRRACDQLTSFSITNTQRIAAMSTERMSSTLGMKTPSELFRRSILEPSLRLRVTAPAMRPFAAAVLTRSASQGDRFARH